MGVLKYHRKKISRIIREDVGAEVELEEGEIIKVSELLPYLSQARVIYNNTVKNDSIKEGYFLDPSYLVHEEEVDSGLSAIQARVDSMDMKSVLKNLS
jgi:hypothetical protein